MIINKKSKCPDCGKIVEGIKEGNGTYRCYCSHCYDWWNEKDNGGQLKFLNGTSIRT